MTGPSPRYNAIDALRGLIMILMAIDHASAFIAHQHAAEYWSGAWTRYSDWAPFVTRLVTHLCAPGFFFLMGAGLAWFAAARSKAGWSDAAIMRRSLWRGFALVLIAQISEPPVLVITQILGSAKVPWSQITAPPPNDGSSLAWGFITLTGLGLVMMACALLLRARPWIWLVVCALSVLATHLLLPADGQPHSLLMALLLAPGLADHVIALYPVIPWLGVAALGMYFGKWWRDHPSRAERSVWLLGIALVLLALVLRALGGFGNIRPPRDSGWIEFFNNIKYPPSLVFWTLAVGINLLLLALLIRLPGWIKSEKSPLIVFGQTPLFFYVIHFYLLAIFGLVLFREPGGLGHLYFMWAVLLALLYPLCLWYRKFKLTKPAESLWRMF